MFLSAAVALASAVIVTFFARWFPALMASIAFQWWRLVKRTPIWGIVFYRPRLPWSLSQVSISFLKLM